MRVKAEWTWGCAIRALRKLSPRETLSAHSRPHTQCTMMSRAERWVPQVGDRAREANGGWGQ